MTQFLNSNSDPKRRAKAEMIARRVANEPTEPAEPMIAQKLTDNVIETVKETGRDVDEAKVENFIGELFV